MSNLPPAILDAWHYTVSIDAHSVVLPDGCRDLILVATPGHAPRWIVSALDDTARTVDSVAGQNYWGFRLHPGAQVDEATLLQAIGRRPHSDPHDALEQVDTLVHIDSRVADALHALQHSASVEAAAGQLGVSQRSLQRLVSTTTGRAPGYWRGLARVRRAAQVLAHAAPDGPPLVQVAVDHGFADQAHMSRAFRRWFGCTPTGLQTSASLCELVSASGYD